MKYKNEDEAKKEIGNRLKNLIHRKGLNYSQLSEKTDISQSYISRLCNGYYLPTIETLYKIASPLNSSLTDLISGLEYYIKPKGFSFDSEDITSEDMAKYYEEYAKEISLIQLKKNDDDEDFPDEFYNNDGKVVMRTISKEKFKAYDNSMDLIRVKRDTTISYYTKNLLEKDLLEKLEFKSLYVIKPKDGKNTLRKIIPVINKEDRQVKTIIAVPFSNNDQFKPTKYSIDEIKSIHRAFHMEVKLPF
jgi:transcriptional regulator with XRE-family HTH domain